MCITKLTWQCVWHGCRLCYPKRDTLVPGGGQTVEDAYQLTLKKEQKLRKAGYTVVSIWEHEVRQQLKRDPDMHQYFLSVEIVDCLDPRDSFFGGRTNALKLLYTAKEGEKLRYIDVCRWV